MDGNARCSREIVVYNTEEYSEWFKVLNNNFQSKHHRHPEGEIYNN